MAVVVLLLLDLLVLTRKIDLVQDKLYFVEFLTQSEAVVERSVVEMMMMKMKVLLLDSIGMMMDVVVH
jgi:hypothetical protein